MSDKKAVSAKKSATGDANSADALIEIRRVQNAVEAGELDIRGETSGLDEDSTEVIQALNQTIDALVQPLRLASRVIRKISKGEIPNFVIEDYQGEFNSIKRNVNTFLATMYGMHYETSNLADAIHDGKLHTRGNAWDFEGDWSELVQDVNRILDAVIEPVQEAGDVLGHLADYDLRSRMEGKYKGDHATIKKALNSTAEALDGALGQVSEMAAGVAVVGDQISASSHDVADGAEKQTHSVKDASTNLQKIASSSQQNLDYTEQAQTLSLSAKDAVAKSKEVTDQMVDAMEQIHSSATDTIAIINEINTLSEQTNELATQAATQAKLVGESARGFSVVAQEVRTLSNSTKESTEKLEETTTTISRLTKNSKSDELGELEIIAKDMLVVIRDFSEISMKTKLLALNASVEAAMVDQAGLNLEEVSSTVHDLAKHSLDFSKETDALIQRSVELSKSGEELSRDIGEKLENVVSVVSNVAQLIGDVAEASREQVENVETLNTSMVEVSGVTKQSATSAKQSAQSAFELTAQAERLNKMVGRFQLSVSEG